MLNPKLRLRPARRWHLSLMEWAMVPRVGGGAPKTRNPLMAAFVCV